MTPPDQMSPPPEGGWESLKVDELREELEARGLPKSGNKAELIARLADDDVAQKDNVRAPRAERGSGDAGGGSRARRRRGGGGAVRAAGRAGGGGGRFGRRSGREPSRR